MLRARRTHPTRPGNWNEHGGGGVHVGVVPGARGDLAGGQVDLVRLHVPVVLTVVVQDANGGQVKPVQELQVNDA
jgi:hypothetical protein